MYILAFETANFSCSAAVIWQSNEHDYQRLAFEQIDDSRQIGSQLIPLLQKVIAKSKISFNHLDIVAVTTGPGSFTGVRIGLAVAYGLQLSTKAYVIGINSFKVCAFAHEQSRNTLPVLIALESRNSDLYCQIWKDHDTAQALPFLQSIDDQSSLDHQDLTIIGNGRVHLTDSDIDNKNISMFNAVDLASFAFKIHTLQKHASYPLMPFYLRAPDIK